MNIRLLICDFDNTLYDWVSFFVPSLFKMIATAAGRIGCSEDDLINDLRAVHQQFRDSEHPFALLETEVVRRRFAGLPRDEVARLLDPAFYEFNKSRKDMLRLYPGVLDTLSELRSRGIKIVGHTEARYLAVFDRINRLGLSEFFSRVYCRERSISSHPHGDDVVMAGLSMPTDLVELSHHQAKPAPEVLVEICERENFDRHEVAYVGDSLLKDISMANRAGVYAVWAKYGTAGYNVDYERLVRVSHWTDEDIQNERRLRLEAGQIIPDAVLEDNFSQILGVLEEVKVQPRTACN